MIATVLQKIIPTVFMMHFTELSTTDWKQLALVERNPVAR